MSSLGGRECPVRSSSPMFGVQGRMNLTKCETIYPQISPQKKYRAWLGYRPVPEKYTNRRRGVSTPERVSSLYFEYCVKGKNEKESGPLGS